MRGNVPDFHAYTPSSLKEALSLLAKQEDNWRPMAGGTDLMVVFESGHLPRAKYLNIHGLGELRGINATNEHVDIGALATYTEIRANRILQTEFPNLCLAGAVTGGRAIQNRGTLGGNIANASPAADTPPALLVYRAKVELISEKGSRWVNYEEFHTGYKKMVLAPEELIKTIRLPRRDSTLRHYYRKVGTRKAQAISKVVLASAADIKGDKVVEINIAFGSVAATTIRCKSIETLICGKALSSLPIKEALELLSKEIAPIDDIRSTKEFRLKVAVNLLEECLSALR